MALIIAILMLALLGTVALASLETVMSDRQVAGYQSRSRTSLFAAEAGVAAATAIVRSQAQDLAPLGESALDSWDPAFPTEAAPQQLGTGAYPPAYHVDPRAPQAVQYLQAGQPCWEDNLAGAMSLNVGGTVFRDALWSVRVQGETLDGAQARIEAVVTSCHPYTN